MSKLYLPVPPVCTQSSARRPLRLLLGISLCLLGACLLIFPRWGSAQEEAATKVKLIHRKVPNPDRLLDFLGSPIRMGNLLIMPDLHWIKENPEGRFRIFALDMDSTSLMNLEIHGRQRLPRSIEINSAMQVRYLEQDSADGKFYVPMNVVSTLSGPDEYDALYISQIAEFALSDDRTRAAVRPLRAMIVSSDDDASYTQYQAVGRTRSGSLLIVADESTGLYTEGESSYSRNVLEFDPKTGEESLLASGILSELDFDRDTGLAYFVDDHQIVELDIETLERRVLGNIESENLGVPYIDLIYLSRSHAVLVLDLDADRLISIDISTGAERTVEGRFVLRCEIDNRFAVYLSWDVDATSGEVTASRRRVYDGELNVVAEFDRGPQGHRLAGGRYLADQNAIELFWLDVSFLNERKAERED